MRLLPEEKLEIIQMVTRSEIGVNRTLRVEKYGQIDHLISEQIDHRDSV